MDYFILLTLFVFGLLIGSFLNVVIFRYDTGFSVARGRSKCFSCDKTLYWYELVPLASFLVQGGKCRECKSKISWQYPLVECASGIGFVLAYIKTNNAFISFSGTALFVLTAVLFSLYIVITVYDLRHKIIPDLFSYGAAVVGLCMIALAWYETGFFDLWRFFAGIILFIFFFFFWSVSRGTWMGLGDGKLALSVGFVLGLSQGITAILFSFWIGAIVSVALMVVMRLINKKNQLGMKSEVPFGPFILIGFLLVFIWGIDIETVLSFLAV